MHSGGSGRLGESQNDKFRFKTRFILQYHAQDEFGNVAYGYAHPNAAKEERRDSYGNVRGAYSYIDATGLPKHVAYVADDYGFRVTSSNALPVAPAVPAGH